MSNLNRILQAATAAVALTFSACAANQPETLPTPANNTSALVDATLNASQTSSDPGLIGKFNTATDHGYQIHLLHEIHDQEFLKEVTDDNSYETSVRAAALFNITDQKFLEKILRDRGCDFFIRIAALAQITDPKILNEFAEGPDEQLGETAKRRLEQIGQQ